MQIYLCRVSKENDFLGEHVDVGWLMILFQ